MHMKKLLENFNQYIVEVATCDEQQPIEPGKRFEWVVVYKAHELAGAPPLPDAPYACCPTWSLQPYKKGTLGELAERSLQLALDSGAITLADLAKADMQRMGKQPSKWGTKKIEIKTDIVFGNKTISVKLDGDVQGQTAEAQSTIDQLVDVFEEVFEGWDQVARKLEIDTTRAAYAQLKKTMLRVGKQARLTQKRIRTLLDKDLHSPNEKKRQKALTRYSALLDAEIIDPLGNIIKKELDQGLWNRNHAKRLKMKFNELLDSDPSLRRAFTDEVLTGRRMFGASPGAAAEYILSPDHFYVLAPGVEGYEESLDIFGHAMQLGVRGKSGRSVLPGVTLGNKPAYRFDIKAKALEVAHKTFEDNKKELLAAATK